MHIIAKTDDTGREFIELHVGVFQKGDALEFTDIDDTYSDFTDEFEVFLEEMEAKGFIVRYHLDNDVSFNKP